VSTEELKGKAKEALGAAQEKLGHTLGNRDMETEGAERKHEGKLDAAVGKVKDKAHDIADDVKEKTRE